MHFTAKGKHYVCRALLGRALYFIEPLKSCRVAHLEEEKLGFPLVLACDDGLSPSVQIYCRSGYEYSSNVWGMFIGASSPLQHPQQARPEN